MADDIKSWISIAITPHDIRTDEAAEITRLLDSRFTFVHMRHPDATLRDMRNLIESIPQKYHKRLKLHGHFELIYSFNIGGLHLNKHCPMPPQGFKGALSTSCHTADEVSSAQEFDYITFSPIFPSISKPGYGPTLTESQISGIVKSAKCPVIALGGVMDSNIDIVRRLGFSGYAMLGAIWK